MMKKNIAILAALLMLTACSEDPSTPLSKGKQEQKLDELVVQTVITNPEGNSGSGYLQTLPQLLPATYDNSGSIPTGFETIPQVFSNGHIYVFPSYFGNEKALLRRFARGNDHRLILQGSLPLPSGSSACNVVELNAQKAYLSCQSINQIIVFNPETMQELKKIDLSFLSHTTTQAAPAAMILRDGKLYVGLNQMNSQWMPEENQVEIAVIDTQTDHYISTIRNQSHRLSFATRPIDAHSIFMDEKGDIYLNCLGAFGFKSDFPGGIVRIPKGHQEIDPNYCLRLDNTPIEGLEGKKANYICSMYYAGNGKLYAYALVYDLVKDAAQHPYTALCNVPVLIDLKQQTIHRISGLPISNPQGFGICKHKDLILFSSANATVNGIYTYQPQTGKVEGPIIRVKGWPTFIYSFAQ